MNDIFLLLSAVHYSLVLPSAIMLEHDLPWPSFLALLPSPKNTRSMHQLLKAGGRELLDKLCLSKQFRLTLAHNLPTTCILCLWMGVCAWGGEGRDEPQ